MHDDIPSLVVFVLVMALALGAALYGANERDQRLADAAVCADHLVPAREPLEAWKKALGHCLRR